VSNLNIAATLTVLVVVIAITLGVRISTYNECRRNFSVLYCVTR
jgi:hypothetical protein